MADDIKKTAAEDADRKPEKKVKKKRRGIASFLILFFILAALVSIVVFNLDNIRDRYIVPTLAKLPLVGGFIPNTANNPEDMSAMTSDQMIARINDLESQLSKAQADLKSANDTIQNNQSEIDTLNAFKAQQLQFKQDKAAFDQQVAMGDPQAYADYYASISPDNAERLYPQAAATAAQTGVIQKYLSDIKAMDETNAAAMLQQMIGTDMNLVVSIMQGLDSRIAGNILSEMDPQNAASVIKMMAPFNAAPTVYPTATPNQVVNGLTDLPQLP